MKDISRSIITKKFLKLYDNNGKQIGKPLKVNGEAHKKYARLTDRVPPPEGYIKRKNRLVKTQNVNFVKDFSAEDLKGIKKTGRALNRFVKELKQKGVYPQSKEDLSRLIRASEITPINLQSIVNINKIKNFYQKNTQKYNISKSTVPYKNFQDITRITPTGIKDDFYEHMSRVKPILYRKLFYFMRSRETGCKFQVHMKVSFYKVDPDTDEITKSGWIAFYSKTTTITHLNDILSKIDEALNNIHGKIDKWLQSGSGWRIDKIGEAFLNIVSIKLTKGSSYFKPDSYIEQKVWNPKNVGRNDCFFLSLIAGVHHKDLKLRYNDRLDPFEPYIEMYHFDYNDLPMTMDRDMIKKYEDFVKHNINILYYENNSKIVGNQRLMSMNHYEKTITLVLMYDKKTNKHHYVWARNLSHLLRSQKTKSKNKMHFCDRCLRHFCSETKLDDHILKCREGTGDDTTIRMPEDTTLRFTNHHKQLELPFRISADFETMNCRNVWSSDSHRYERQHEPSGAKYSIYSNIHKKCIKQFIFRGKDCVRIMLKQLHKDCENLYYEYFYNHKQLNMTMEEEKVYNESDICHICKEGDFCEEDTNRQKVRDHCHLTGKFRGSAHSKCNIQYQVRNIFPIFFHNLKGFDSHFIIKNLDKQLACKIKAIPISSSKFLSFSLHFSRGIPKTDKKTHKNYLFQKPTFEIRFIDSFSFMPTSLQNCVDIMETKDFKCLMKFVKDHPSTMGKSVEEVFKMFISLKQKGIYPYEYIDGFDRFDETSLPPKEYFFSRLKYEVQDYGCLSKKEKDSLDADYQHALKVWKMFGCKNLGDYHDLYLSTDVYLLMDMFNRFCDMSMNKFKLDPCHYYGLPSLANDSMLKMTRARIELFGKGEEDKYEFCEKAKIGGVSGTGGLRYACANNKYSSTYDPSKPSNFIIYCDANALYSWAMKQKLPIGQYQWETSERFFVSKEKHYILREDTDVDGDYSGLIEVDAYLPNEYHDIQNDYPCFPENIDITKDMWSPYQREMFNYLNKGKQDASEIIGVSLDRKLSPNLKPKVKHVIHLKTLKLFMELGWKITKVHRVLSFRQEAWMEPYIDMCMSERAMTDLNFEKDFWKLSSNAVFGKQLENVRDYRNIEFRTELEDLQVYCNKYTMDVLPIQINEFGLHKFELKRQTTTLCKPIATGVSILGLSKYWMYDFFYNTLRKKYPGCSMLYTDTDSFMISVETDDFYKDLVENEVFREKWDLSNYKPTHPMFENMSRREAISIINKNKKVAGKFKDETSGKIINEYVGIRSKVYSLDVDSIDKPHICASKGTKKQVKDRKPHYRFRDCVLHKFNRQNMIQKDSMTSLVSDNFHNVYLQHTIKTSFSTFDTKKYILDDGITQLSYGHFRINKL